MEELRTRLASEEALLTSLQNSLDQTTEAKLLLERELEVARAALPAFTLTHFGILQGTKKAALKTEARDEEAVACWPMWDIGVDQKTL